MDATIQPVIGDYDVGNIEDELAAFWCSGQERGGSDRFDATYQHAEAPSPTTDDVTDLVTTAAAAGAWMDPRSGEPSPNIAAAR